MLFLNITPKSNWILWKLHRLILKRIKRWRVLQLPNGKILRIKYFAEGKFNYVFKIKGDTRLLRITRKQFYQLSHPVDTDEVCNNCKLMNSLAEKGLSVSAKHLIGGACLVDDAGSLLVKYKCCKKDEIFKVFNDLKEWSLENKIVILDYNERNWCKRAEIKIIDVDVNYTCLLTDIRKNKIVLKRIDVNKYNSDEMALEAFLLKEAELLWQNLIIYKKSDQERSHL